MLQLLLSHFSRVRPSATPWTAAFQAPPSLGFSRQEYWSGVPLPSPYLPPNIDLFPFLKSYIYLPAFSFGMSSFRAAKLLQSCPTLCDPIDGSPPGSPVPGIFQARTLEWGTTAFSKTFSIILNISYCWLHDERKWVVIFAESCLFLLLFVVDALSSEVEDTGVSWGWVGKAQGWNGRME